MANIGELESIPLEEFPYKHKIRVFGAGDSMVSSIYLALAVPLCVARPSLVRILETSAIKFVGTFAIRDLVIQFPLNLLVCQNKIQH